MAAPGIISVKSFTYRDAVEEWSNRYHFLGDPPSDPGGWRDLCDAFAALEAPALAITVNILRFLCYEDTDNDSVYTYDLAAFSGVVPGTYNSASGADPTPGDTAYVCRWDTGRRTSTGKPIYLRKYFHGGHPVVGDPDVVEAALKTRVQTFADDVMSATGDWPGLAGPDHAAATGALAMPWLTTRTLKRRGRRP